MIVNKFVENIFFELLRKNFLQLTDLIEMNEMFPTLLATQVPSKMIFIKIRQILCCASDRGHYKLWDLENKIAEAELNS